MASFVDMLNTGLGAFNTPLGQFGTQMLMASGPQQGNPGFANRMGQAMGGFAQAQAQQQEMEYMKQLRAVQQMTAERQMQQMKREDTQRTQVMDQVKTDPTFLAQYPMARQAAGATGDLSMAAELAKLTPGAKPPSMKQTYDQHNADGTVTQQIYDYTTGTYKQGSTYTPTAQQAVDLNATYRPKEYELKQQTAQQQQQNQQATAEANMAKLELARSKEDREAAEALRKNAIDSETLRQNYTGADAQINEVVADANALMQHPGFNSLFGPNGMITPVPGTAAADAKAMYDQFVSKMTLSEVQRLNNMGVKLNPMSNLDLQTIQNSATGLTKSMSDSGARQTLEGIINRLNNSRTMMSDNYNRLSNLYQQPVQSPSSSQQSNIVRTGTAPDGRKVIEYSDGRIEYAN